ncbi:hypothetical protein ACWDSJ_11345 [Nocardia sp. NPDC003482]
MITRLRFATLAVSALTALTLSAGGCANPRHKENVAVDRSLTEEAARQGIFSYLQKTADETGIGFSLTPDGTNYGKPLGPPGRMPCFDGYQERGPHQVQASYWVVGVPAGQTQSYFARLRDTWKTWGWRLNATATSTLAGLETPDHYTFALRDTGKGDGWLSVTAGSPCFPYEGLGPTTPHPTRIDPKP